MGIAIKEEMRTIAGKGRKKVGAGFILCKKILLLQPHTVVWHVGFTTCNFVMENMKMHLKYEFNTVVYKTIVKKNKYV